MKDENDKHEKIEAVGKRDMGVLLLSLLAKEKAGLELRKLDLKSTEEMCEQAFLDLIRHDYCVPVAIQILYDVRSHG